MSSQIVVRLADKQKKRLQLEAQKQKTTVASVVREAVAGYFVDREVSGQQPKRNILGELIKIGEAVSKRVKRKYPRDISSNYKYYLYGEGRIK